ncbi:uncharacterized protein [Engystomops pustulosus]|uniref:uncharacterized protein isoform X2 n=1 Tax=Engystomops pustulosus TaxID=76066 RepID=UPI003AFB3DE3
MAVQMEYCNVIANHMEILEERNIFKEFMKYPLKHPQKNLELQVLSLHLRPSSRNKSIRNFLDNVVKNSHSGKKLQLDGRRRDNMITQDKLKMDYNSPEIVKRHKNIEYEMQGEKYWKIKDKSNKRNKVQKPLQPREPKLKLEREAGEEYEAVKRKNIRSKRIEHFARSGPKKITQTIYHNINPTIEETQRSKIIPESWEVGHLELTPMMDGEVLSEETPLIHDHLQQVDVLQTRHYQDTKNWGILDRNLNFFSDGGRKVTSTEPYMKENHLEVTKSTLVPISNGHFLNENAKHHSVMDFPTRNGDNKPPGNPQLWRVVVPVEDLSIIDIDSDTIHPAETHTEPYRADNKTHKDIVFQAEGSGQHNSLSVDHEDLVVTPNKGQTTHNTQEFLQSQPTVSPSQSSYNTSPYVTYSKYSEVSGVGKEMLNRMFSPLESTMNHNPGSIYCKPGYKAYGGVCKSQCDIGGINCGNNGQCVIVENIGAMCRCRQMNSLCDGGECCRSSLATFQLVCVIGGCCILLSMFLGSLPFFIRRMDVKAISKSVRTRLWISTLMPQSSTLSSSQSSDFTTCSDCESPLDPSSLYQTKEVRANVARHFTMWQCERTQL